MNNVLKYFKVFLLALTLVQAAAMAWDAVGIARNAQDMVQADGRTPVAGDMINMVSAARLTVAGRTDEIYRPEAFMAFEHTLIAHDIGLRLWAYPPHSLLVVWPLGLPGFWVALGLWSALGLGLLAWGARRVGFDWIETTIIVLSPAALASVYFGQTGNFAAGLLLLALSARRRTDGLSVAAAALLTIKPQAGFLLPVIWLVRRQFRMIALTGLATVGLVALSVAVFGADLWRQYILDTLTTLSALERNGSGAFLAMVPSVFVAIRLLAGDATLAGGVHLAVAAGVAVYVAWRLVRAGGQAQQIAVVLAGTVLITPYMHIYDLAPVVGAALLVARRLQAGTPLGQVAAGLAVLAAWGMPAITLAGNSAGLPFAPAIPLVLLLLAGWGAWSTMGGGALGEPAIIGQTERGSGPSLHPASQPSTRI